MMNKHDEVIERTVSFGWKEDVHELAREIVRVKESGEQTKIISMVHYEYTGQVSAIVVYERISSTDAFPKGGDDQ